MTVKAVVLAAGKGTRMKSELPKVLHEVAGRSMVNWVLAALAGAGVDETTVVIGHGAEAVVTQLPQGVATAIQAEQLGTAHATKTGLADMTLSAEDVVVVLPGDMPLIRSETLAALLSVHTSNGAVATLLSSIVDDPTGYGRILRDDAGAVTGVVEHKDATGAQHAIQEVATGVYAFSAGVLSMRLEQVSNDNAQGEYYLPDVIGLLAAAGQPMAAMQADPYEGLGVNSHAQLAEIARLARARINAHWMSQGVWMLDPDRVYIDADVELEAGVRLHPDVQLRGATIVRAGAEIGPNVVADDCEIGENARVLYAVMNLAKCGNNTSVGPFAYLRPNAVLEERAKAGTFVELKNTKVGSNSKVPHLSYMGDVTIGADSNIGAGSISCNYDGYAKHGTVVGDRVKVGSNTMLVAPVEIGDDGWTAAGSVIVKDVAPGSLGVSRSPQKDVAGYAERRRKRAEKEG